MISTHILDTSKGVPAAGIPVKLRFRNGDSWAELAVGKTNSDGRCSFECEIAMGIYKIVFEVEEYLKKQTKDYFYSKVPVVFKVTDVGRKYHVPLLLNPFGYSTYRGS
ncbi:MAG: hydroxyisourate hydrolase [Pseudomonadota bacterium]|nr:hydroxyisourate hydrolase [Pseudomonadota bacterium]